MIVSGGLRMPITACTRRLNTTDMRAGKRPKRATNYTKNANVAGKRTIGGGTKIDIAGTNSAIGMIAITIQTIDCPTGMTTGDNL